MTPLNVKSLYSINYPRIWTTLKPSPNFDSNPYISMTVLCTKSYITLGGPVVLVDLPLPKKHIVYAALAGVCNMQYSQCKCYINESLAGRVILYLFQICILISFSYPSDMDIVSLFLVCCLVCCLERCRLAPFCRQGTPTFYNIPSTLLPQISQGFPIDPHPDEMRWVWGRYTL